MEYMTDKPLTKDRILEIIEIMKQNEVSPEDVEQIYYYIICHLIITEGLDINKVVSDFRENLEKGVKTMQKSDK